jgi:hypothetical protein
VTRANDSPHGLGRLITPPSAPSGKRTTSSETVRGPSRLVAPSDALAAAQEGDIGFERGTGVCSVGFERAEVTDRLA